MADQSQVVQWIQGLIPEINTTRDPQGALLKFAKDNNLAPAQLQKLGHVFNQVKTLSYLDKNPDNRGSNFSILDVESMVDSYGESDLAKSASFEKKASTTSEPIVLDRMPNMFPSNEGKALDREKLAQQIETNYTLVKRAYTNQSYEKRNRENLEQVIFETELGIKDSMNKFAMYMRMNPEVDFKSAHEDIWKVEGEKVAQTVTDVAGFLERRHYLKIEKAADAGKDRLVNISEKKAYDMLMDIHERREFLKAANALLDTEFTVSEVSKSEDSRPEDLFDMVELKKNDLEKSALEFETAPQKSEIWKPQEKQETTGGGSKYPKSGGPEPKDNVEDDTKKKDSDGGGDGGKGGKGGKGQGDGGDAGPPFSDMHQDFEAKKKNVQEAYDIARSPFDTVPSFMKDLMPEEERFNAGQQKVDDAYLEAQQEATFNKLLINDPVLSNLSEEEENIVSAAFNSLVNVAPNVASDAATLRPFLRQAIEYGGVTPLEMKAMMEMEQQMNKLKIQQGNIAKDTYSIPGTKGAPKSRASAKDDDK
jgi:hypothetical protein